VPISEELQRVLYFFYYANFTAKLTVSFGGTAQGLPAKIKLMNKTGYYAIDTIGIHIVLIGAITFLILLKKLKSISKLLSWFY